MVKILISFISFGSKFLFWFDLFNNNKKKIFSFSLFLFILSKVSLSNFKIKKKQEGILHFTLEEYKNPMDSLKHLRNTI